MKIKLKKAKWDFNYLMEQLQLEFPQFHYAIRNGRFKQFLVVSNDSQAAAIITLSRDAVAIFRGFRSQTLQMVWILTWLFTIMYFLSALFVVYETFASGKEIFLWSNIRLDGVPLVFPFGFLILWLIIWKSRQDNIIQTVSSYIIRINSRET